MKHNILTMWLVGIGLMASWLVDKVISRFESQRRRFVD